MNYQEALSIVNDKDKFGSDWTILITRLMELP